MPQCDQRWNQIDERPASVVDVRRPLEPVYFASFWIDRERGVALRLEYYDEAPRAGSRKNSSANSIKLYQVPNGGWIPVAGRRTFHFKGGDGISDVNVDTNSISIQAEDIPDTVRHGSSADQPALATRSHSTRRITAAKYRSPFRGAL
jgi:hypothetical protein